MKRNSIFILLISMVGLVQTTTMNNPELQRPNKSTKYKFHQLLSHGTKTIMKGLLYVLVAYASYRTLNLVSPIQSQHTPIPQQTIYTALAKAVDDGNLTKIQQILQQGIDLSDSDFDTQGSAKNKLNAFAMQALGAYVLDDRTAQQDQRYDNKVVKTWVLLLNAGARPSTEHWGCLSFCKILVRHPYVELFKKLEKSTHTYLAAHRAETTERLNKLLPMALANMCQSYLPN